MKKHLKAGGLTLGVLIAVFGGVYAWITYPEWVVGTIGAVLAVVVINRMYVSFLED